MRGCPILPGLLVSIKLFHKLIKERTKYSRNARPLNLQDVIIGADGEVITCKSECEVWQTGPFGAVNRILPIPALFGTYLRVPRLD